MKRLLCIFSAWLALCGYAGAQLSGGSMFPGPGLSISAATSYSGPGDVVSGATFWGSCARVYTAAQASTATSLCDLVDSAAPTVTICTLRGSSTGFVDLAGAYCTGSVTPATKCAAATGAVCNIKQVYDQTGTGNHLIQTTAANQPILTFSGAGSLPGLTGTAARGTFIASSGSITQALPFSMSIVVERTAGTSSVTTFGQRITTSALTSGSGVNNLGVNLGSAVNIAATDNAFHCMNATLVSGAGTIANLDGTDSGSLNAGTTGFTGNPIGMFRTAGTSFEGVIMEAGFWPTTSFSSGNRSSICTQQRSLVSGYNF